MPSRVLIPISQGFSARYVLQTDILPELLKQGHAVGLLVERPADFAAYASTPGITLLRYETQACREYRARARGETFLHRLRSLILSNRGSLASMEGKWRAYWRDRDLRARGGVTRVSDYATALLVWVGKRSRFVRRCLLWVETRFYAPLLHAEVFESFRPDWVVTLSLGIFDFDEYVMREARVRGIPVCAIIQSWDNPSCKGMPGASVDRAIVWGETMRRELIELSDIAPERIEVAGVPHFDIYHRRNQLWSREAVCRRLGLDPARPVLLLGTKSPNNFLGNAAIARTIAHSIQAGELDSPGGRPQLVVRAHPIYLRRRQGELMFAQALEELRAVGREFPDIVINEPITTSEVVSFLMPEEEIVFLASLLAHTSVLINMFSTLNIEACLLDVPIVNVSYDPVQPPQRVKARYNIRQDEEQNHNARMAASGALDMVRSDAELLRGILEALLQPEARRAQRAQVARSEGGARQGDAGRYIAELLGRLSVARGRDPGVVPKELGSTG